MKTYTLEKYIIYISIFLFPLIFSKSFENIFDTPKILILFSGAILVLVLKLARTIIKKGIEFNSSKLDLPVAFFIIIYLISGIFASPNKVDSFLLPGTATFSVLAGIYYFLINQFTKEDKDTALTVLVSSGFLMAILQLTSFLGITMLIPQINDVVKLNYFTPSGNILNSIFFLSALVPYLLSKLFTKNDIAEKILASIVCTVFLISIFTSVYLILPNKVSTPKILNFKYGWSIAVDALKTNPLLGVGPSNFNYAFNRFKPIEVNLDQNWNVKFIRSSSTILNIFTEVGILGLAAILSIFIYALKKMNFKNPLFFAILVLVLGMSLLPLSEMIFPFFFMMLAFLSNNKENKLAFFSKKYAVLFLTIPFISILIIISYLAYRAFYAEIIYAQSLNSIKENQGLEAYKKINKSIALNKFSDKYHLLSASINLSVAQNIAKNTEITDADKETVSGLIQQSIVESRAAVAVNSKKSNNWESLAKVYEAISGFASGSSVFAVESLNQSISLDPTNPLLRIRLGGLYYSQKKYDEAIEAFKLAVLAKPNLANSHYNLARVYKEDNQPDKAKEQYNIVLTLLEKDSEDYQIVKKELENPNQSENLPDPILPTE